MSRKRFRASIYVDVFIEDEEDLEKAREKATKQVQEIVEHISETPKNIAPDVCNPYVGGVAHYTPENLLKPLDKEI